MNTSKDVPAAKPLLGADSPSQAKFKWHSLRRESLARARAAIKSAPGSKNALQDLCAANPIAALDLVENCPALAVLIVLSCPRRKPEAQSAYYHRMLECSWRHLIRSLDLPAAPQTIRLLQKVPLAHCDARTARNLAKVIRRGRRRMVRLLTHISRITQDTVALICRHPDVVTPQLLTAASLSEWGETSVTWTVGAVRASRKEQGRPGAWPYAALTFSQLMLVEGRLHDITYRRTLHPFPEPPFQGIPRVIEPIRCYDRLLIETNEVGCNFVGGLEEILEGKLFLYSMPGPTRATVIIRRDNADDVWRLHPICAAREDENVDPQTNARVVRWFCAASATTTTNI